VTRDDNTDNNNNNFIARFFITPSLTINAILRYSTTGFIFIFIPFENIRNGDHGGTRMLTPQHFYSS